jgi:hypothetical protein
MGDWRNPTFLSNTRHLTYAPAYGAVYIGGGWGDDHYGRSGYGRGHDHGYWSPLAEDGMVVELGPAVATAVPDMAVVTVAATVNNLILYNKDS